jgi:predicted MFS family arabinose efflux permease
MSLLADGAEVIGLDYAYAFALVSLAWAPSAALGAAGGGALAQATTDRVPFLLLASACVLTLVLVVRMGPAREAGSPGDPRGAG